MGLFDSIKKLFGGKAASAPESARRAPVFDPIPDPEPEPEVVEVSVADLMAELQGGADLVLLDCRESYERQMAHLPNDLHIPMSEIPHRLEELSAITNNKVRTVVVYCASGMRSFGVTHFLGEQGFNARNLSGGVTRWQMLRGPIERG